MDLYVAIVVMATVAVVVFVAVAGYLSRRRIERHPRLPGLLLTLFVCLAVGLLFGTKDFLYWARWIPFSAAIIYSNFTVLALAAAAGSAARLPNRPVWRQILSAIPLLLLSVAALVQPIVQPLLRPVAGGDKWAEGNVCLQTREATCSAAAAATLLAAHRIDVTEAQMVDWCLTDARGTLSLGLWRGLYIATQDTDMEPEVLNVSVDTLIETGPWPAILSVGLPPGEVDPIYTEKYGWSPGFRHSVVLFGRNPAGLLDIGDPSIGREAWSEEDMRVLWREEAVRVRVR